MLCESSATGSPILPRTNRRARASEGRAVLIVSEQGSKLPADLGGDIHALLQRADIGPICCP